MSDITTLANELKQLDACRSKSLEALRDVEKNIVQLKKQVALLKSAVTATEVKHKQAKKRLIEQIGDVYSIIADDDDAIARFEDGVPVMFSKRHIAEHEVGVGQDITRFVGDWEDAIDCCVDDPVMEALCRIDTYKRK